MSEDTTQSQCYQCLTPIVIPTNSQGQIHLCIICEMKRERKYHAEMRKMRRGSILGAIRRASKNLRPL